MFMNRKEAGRKLADTLKQMPLDFNIVLAIPRGGIVVAAEIAREFQVPLDIVMARKIGSPNLPEYAIGAIAPDGEILVHEKGVEKNWFKAEEISYLTEKVKKEINDRLDMYRSSKKAVDIAGKKILLVDDGIATGFTIKAAVNYLRRLKASKVYISVPVSSSSAYLDINEVADFIIVLEMPKTFYAVGQVYEDFSEVEDKQVITILQELDYSPLQPHQI